MLIYRRTGNLRAVQLLLGHSKIESTVRYLGIEVDDAIEIAEKIEIRSYNAIPLKADTVGGAYYVADFCGANDRFWDFPARRDAKGCLHEAFEPPSAESAIHSEADVS